MTFDLPTFQAALAESRRALRTETHPDRPASRTSRCVMSIVISTVERYVLTSSPWF